MDSNEMLLGFRDRQKKFEAWMPQLTRIIELAQAELHDLCVAESELVDFLDKKINESLEDREIMVFVEGVDEHTDTSGEFVIEVMEFTLFIASYLVSLSWHVLSEHFYVRVASIELVETESLSFEQA